MTLKPFLFSISSHPDAIHVNPLKITFLKPLIDFSEYDYLILTSKQAVKALKEYPETEYKAKPALCISKATAKSFDSLGAKVLDIAGGYGDDLSQLIQEYPKETKWLYLRAKEIASDFAQASRDKGYLIDEVVVYESSCSNKIKNIFLKDDSYLIFTSPSSIKCFLKYHQFKESNTVVVIGKTTALALPKNIKSFIADEPTIESCLKVIDSLKKT